MLCLARKRRSARGLVCLLFFAGCSLLARNCPAASGNDADSLYQALYHAREDSEKVKLMLHLTEAYQNSSIIRALYFANASNDYSRKINWPAGLMLSQYAIGDCYMQIREYGKAISHYRMSLGLAGKLGRNDIALKALFAASEAYKNAGNQQASVYFKRLTLDHAHRTGDVSFEIQMLNLLAGAYYDSKQYSVALQHWNKCLALIKKTPRRNAEAMVLNNLAGAYMDVRKFDNARLCLNRGMAMIAGTADSNTKSFISITFCDYYKRLGLYDSALRYGKQALWLSGQLNNGYIREVTLNMLEEIYEHTGHPAAALDCYKKYIIIRDSLLHEQQSIEDNRQVMKYDFDKRVTMMNEERDASDKISHDQRTALFAIGSSLVVVICLAMFLAWSLMQNRRKSMTISGQSMMLQAQKDEIQKSLQQKEILLKEIHHRVKNNLQVISSLMELQAIRISDEAARKALKAAQNRVFSIAMIHQKLYQNEQLDSVEFPVFANELFAQLNRAPEDAGSVRFDNRVPKIFIGTDRAVPLGLILNELITNSFKYALENNPAPKIILDLLEEEGFLIFIYSDNGRGLPDDLFFKDTKSLGLHLVKRLSKQMGGWADYRFDGGPVFTIHLPRK